MKILSNKKYKKLKEAEFDSILYYNACECLKEDKNKIVDENIVLKQSNEELEQIINLLKKEIELLKEKIKKDKKKTKTPKKSA